MWADVVDAAASEFGRSTLRPYTGMASTVARARHAVPLPLNISTAIGAKIAMLETGLLPCPVH
jgi:hypothetical protein